MQTPGSRVCVCVLVLGRKTHSAQAEFVPTSLGLPADFRLTDYTVLKG